MTRPIVLHPSNLPASSPLCELAVAFLLLAHFNAPEWAYWLFALFVAVTLYGWILLRKNAVQVDLFAEAKRKEEE